jgi:act minimal PKS ketosynthase (KS/KS alpha)
LADRRVVITGVGVVAPGGKGVRQFLQLLCSGRTATGRISFFDPSPFRSQVAGECALDAAADGLAAEERAMDRVTLLALLAARECLADSGAGFQGLDPGRVGVSIGTAVGCTMGLEEEYVAVSDGGRKWLVDHERAVPHLYDYYVPSSIVTQVAWLAAAEGPVAAVSTGCTSGIDALGHAYRLIQEGAADVMVAGAAEAPISPITVACFDAIKATTPRNDDPAHASRPFDRSRDGFVLAEGAAVMVMEELGHALRRGARVYAEVAGYAARSNAFHMTGLRPDGREMAEAIRQALGEARLNPDDIDYVNAHGSGTRQNDRHETAAFKRSLGSHAYRTPVSSIKSMIGHSLGAIGSIELAACALAIENDFIPPTANLHEQDPECDLDYVPLEARQARLGAVLSVGSGFGGFQSAMVLTRPGRLAA